MNTAQIPVLKTVDAVVLGAGTAAVSAALALRKAGRSVYVVSDRAYFGDEYAGSLEITAAQGASGRPGAAKHELDKSLVEAGVEFLFLARPVALSPAGEEKIDVVVASRTALFIVRTTHLLDASLESALFALPGLHHWSSRPRPSVKAKGGSLVFLADASAPAPAFPDTGVTAIGEQLPYQDRPERFRINLQTYRATLPAREAHFTPETAGAEARMRALISSGSIELLADVLRWDWESNGSEGLADDPQALSDDVFFLHPQLSFCGSALPLTSKGAARLYEPERARELGARLGGLVSRAGTAPRIGETAGAAEGTFRFSPTFLRENEEVKTVPLPEWPVIEGYDIVVAGGGTGGAPAAIAAARGGKKVLLLEQQRKLGGVGTSGSISSYWFGNKVGFTRELDSDLHAMDSRYRSDDATKRPLTQWNAEVKAGWFLNELLRAGGEAWLGSYAFGVRMEDDRVTAVLVSTPYGPCLVPCDCTIDASGSADIAAAAGAPCRVIDAHHSAVQGTGLSLVAPGKHYINSDFTFADDSDPCGITYAYVQARAKFKDEFDTISFLNTRERRQIIGQIELSPLDFLAKRTFPDVINVALSNFDTHGFTIHPVFAVTPPDHAPLEANVPLRCLLPREIRGVIVTGLGMSAHRDSLPVIRMQADVQNQGYAAGLAAVMACGQGGDFGRIDARALQQQLVSIGGLPEEALEWGDSFPLAEREIEAAVQESPVSLFSAAILLAHPEQSIPLLRHKLDPACDPVAREEAALMLGLMGDVTAAPVLTELIGGRDWDEGWNYRGMGQFGLSASRLDAMILALSLTGWQEGTPAVVEKIRALDAEAAFSHCRAVSIATSAFATPDLVAALQALLELPGIQGHSITSFQQGIDIANADPVETAARNLSLRELYIARGLYLAGDPDGAGRRVLERYRRDLRGPYARHAAALLTAGDVSTLRKEVI